MSVRKIDTHATHAACKVNALPCPLIRAAARLGLMGPEVPYCENVHTYALGAALLSAPEECCQLIVAAVHPTVGQQANEVDCVAAESRGDVFPALSSECVAIVEGNVNQPGTLVSDLPGTPASHCRATTNPDLDENLQ